MRYSKQREMVKVAVMGTNNHPTADWVYDKVRKTMPSISLGTIYRNLKQLQEEGEIKAINDGSLIRYDRNTMSHNHLKCSECGTLIDIELGLDNLEKTIKMKYNFNVDEVEMKIIGKCQKHS